MASADAQRFFFGGSDVASEGAKEEVERLLASPALADEFRRATDRAQR